MTYRRVLDHVIVTREVLRREHGVVQFRETCKRPAQSPRSHLVAIPAATFDVWARTAQIVSPTPTPHT